MLESKASITALEPQANILCASCMDLVVRHERTLHADVYPTNGNSESPKFPTAPGSSPSLTGFEANQWVDSLSSEHGMANSHFDHSNGDLEGHIGGQNPY